MKPVIDPTSEPWLASVPDMLQELAEQREVKAGATLFRRGETPRSIFYVFAGEIRLLRRERDGMEIILQRSRSGFVAEASVESAHYHCSAEAVEASQVLCFPIQAFRAALDEDRVFRREWMVLLAREVRKLRAQCERLCLNTAADRIIHYIESEGMDGSVELDQTRKAWAAGLGLTHETVYRTLRRLKQQGLLKIESAHITVIR